MDKSNLRGATIIGMAETGGNLWGVLVELPTGETVEIETGDKFTPLAVKMVYEP